jgi:hypothetical protein
MSYKVSQNTQHISVTITFGEHDRRSRAVARLRWRGRGSGGIGR